jgi:NADP-dependent 3-hydroxy acid dehydrogenase YdfG
MGGLVTTEAISDPTVIITGASRGIGLATAKRFAASGARTVLVARSRDSLESAVQEIAKTGGAAWSWTGDLTQAKHTDDLITWTMRTVGPPDICVFNAGRANWGSSMEMDDLAWRETFSINVDSVFFLTRAVLRSMVPRRRGHLVYVSSVLARRAVPNMSAYSASKAAVAAFAETVGAEMKPNNIKVTVMYPGTTATTMRDHHVGRPRTPDITEPELQLAPEDVAEAIVWATQASDRAFPTALTVEPRGMAGRRG